MRRVSPTSLFGGLWPRNRLPIPAPLAASLDGEFAPKFQILFADVVADREHQRINALGYVFRQSQVERRRDEALGIEPLELLPRGFGLCKAHLAGGFEHRKTILNVHLVLLAELVPGEIEL